MQRFLQNRPVVLTFAGHDPAGGAGIQADIESIGQCGCRALSIITLLTAQNSMTVLDYYSQPINSFKKQTTVLFKEYKIDAIKIGAIADPQQVAVIIELLDRFRAVPLIFDPVVAPTSGPHFADVTTIEALKRLLPYVYLFTPNLSELVHYTGIDHVEPAIAMLLHTGCKNILLTSAQKTQKTHTHLLYNHAGRERFNVPTLVGQYRGSGCTLSSAIASYTARGLDIRKAIESAQDYVTQALIRAEPVSQDVFIPTRILT